MTSLRRWAASEHDLDVLSTWTETIESHGCVALDLDPAIAPHVPRINGQTALKLSLLSLSRTVEAICAEHRAVDPRCIKRWAGGGRS